MVLWFVVVFICLIFAESANPFIGKEWFIEPSYTSNVQDTIEQYPAHKSLLQKAQNVSTFYWIDSIEAIGNISTILQQAQSQAIQNNSNILVPFVIYNIPDRDCSSAASNGEIICSDAQCAQGIQKYETEYINPLVNIFGLYPNLTIIIVIEPNSLANMATNMNIAKCAQAQNAYITCNAYAIKQFTTLSNVYLYVDAANGGWLGWADNMAKYVEIIGAVLQSAATNTTIQGFATNIGTYQPLDSITSSSDPCHMKQNYNNCINEAIYIQTLNQQMNIAGINGMHYITDTSRNGHFYPNYDAPYNMCGYSCNDNRTGLHYKPTTQTDSTGIGDIIDAFGWISIPGISEGSENVTCTFRCMVSNTMPNAPCKGEWFPAFFLAMCQNSKPPLE